MASTLKIITELSDRTVSKLTSRPSEWTAFLLTAAQNYKYSFTEQVLIYAQRPVAIACAPIELWNERFGRRVKRGSYGIALIDDNGSKLRLRYVFDISDTVSQYNRPVPIWRMESRYQDSVIEALEAGFGELESKANLSDTIISAANNAAEDNMTDYLSELMTVRDGSFLEELDDFNVEVSLKRAIRASVAYIALIRCGIDTSKYFETDDFIPVLDFSTLPTISLLGGAVSDISEMVLREIGDTIRHQHISENHKLAKSKYIVQNVNVSRENDAERSDEYGSDVHDEGRLPAARPDAAGAADHREIWNAAQIIPQKTPESDVHQPASFREPDGASGGDRPDSEGARGADDSTDGRDGERERGDESRRPDEVDGADEQPEALGGGDGFDRTDLQLNLLPGFAEQIELIEQAEAEKSSASAIFQEDIDYILQRGSGFRDGKHRIVQYYAESHSNQDAAAFLKKEYGVGGGTIYFPNGEHGFADHGAKGIRIKKDGIVNPDIDVLVAWPKVARRIGELISFSRYLTWEEKERLPVYEAERADSARHLMEERETRDTLSLGAEVHIDADTFEIIAIDSEHVVLFDPAFPLFNKDMSRDEFERKIRENPLNDYLITESPEPSEEVTQEEAPALEELLHEVMVTHNGDAVTITGPAVDGDTEYTKMNVTLTEEPELLKPAWEKHTDSITRVRFDLAPEVPAAERLNFRITDDNLGHGGQKTKYGFNTEAIKLLKRLESEKRFATAEEQEILSRYVGWGGIPQAFDENNPSWSKEYAELKGLLTEEEYIFARESTLNAHYTSPMVIKAIYTVLENMGFKTGNVLEPGCGIGNFFGLVPESMSGSKFYGVELDSITGRIARQLYQKNSIAIQGYETADLPDSFFDIAIGNVPFGAFGVADRKYDRLKLHIHDYFFAKTLDKVRPGGIIAFITSKGTLDKQNPEVRRYIAQRAELLGAIRLPSNAFLANAGTEVTADILFLQKRDLVIDIELDWVHLSQTPDGIPVNQYFADHPDMVLGTMAFCDKMYGSTKDTTCNPIEGADLSEQILSAIANIQGEIADFEVDDLAGKEEESIPADPTVRNFSYAVVDGKLFYRENSRMNPVETSVTAESRIKSMIAIRNCVRTLIEYQTEDYGDEDIRREQAQLNKLYDAFSAKYGLISSRGNSMAFSDDSSYCLLCSLEILDEDGNLARKADMFTKRTIRRKSVVTQVDTASEALAVSMAERARVDMDFMGSLTGLAADELTVQLVGVVFRLPEPTGYGGNPRYVTADEYLSGNVREKLATAREAAELSDVFISNVKALEAVQPTDLTASEISVRLGATWLSPEVVEQFMFELLGTAWYDRRAIRVHYLPYTSEWNIEGKSRDKSSVKAFTTYGTERINAYKIIEETLNLRDVRIFDVKYDDNGNKQYVLNRKETAIAQAKQELIKSEFSEWLWKDQKRREKLCRLYNDKFNSTRPREYDGSHIKFVGMNPEITLRPHQVNAIAHILYGGNALLAHVVGAGKSATRS